MKAERRIYLDTGMPSTEAAIKRNFFSHLYIVMGQEQPTGSGNRIIRVYHNPHIIFIWLGAIIMAFGGISFFARLQKKSFLKNHKFSIMKLLKFLPLIIFLIFSIFLYNKIKFQKKLEPLSSALIEKKFPS